MNRSDKKTEKNSGMSPAQSPSYAMDSANQHYADDEIDLRELWQAIWCRKWSIIAITAVVSFIALFFALSAKNYYKAEVVLAPAQSDSKSGGLGQLGGLAAMAGISMGGGGGSSDTAISILKSRQYGERFIKENDLKSHLFSDSWDSESQSWIVAEPGFLSSLRSKDDGVEAVAKYQREELAEGEPTLWNAYKAFKGILAVNQDKASSIVNLSVEFTDPVLAATWANQMVKDINSIMREQTLTEARLSNEYLERELQKTNLAEVKQTIYALMEGNIKSMMLANTNDDAVFKVIDPAVVPEEKSKPKRALILAVGMVLGLMLGVFWALIRHAMVKVE